MSVITKILRGLGFLWVLILCLIVVSYSFYAWSNYGMGALLYQLNPFNLSNIVRFAILFALLLPVVGINAIADWIEGRKVGG